VAGRGPEDRARLWERPHVTYLVIAYAFSWLFWIGSWAIAVATDAGDQLFNADLVWALLFEGDASSTVAWLSLLSMVGVWGPMVAGIVATRLDPETSSRDLWRRVRRVGIGWRWYGLALGILIAVFLTSQIIARGWLRSVVFFPVLISAVGIGATFAVLLDPFEGLVNRTLEAVGIDGPGWLTDPNLALISVALVDIWRGVGLAVLIYIAGIVAIPQDYFEAAKVDGANAWHRFWHVILPLMRPATTTVIILSLIGGLRSFDLIWTMTRGGPGFSSDVLASVVYKQYQAGFYGLSTAGNVVLFVAVAAIILPLFWFLNRKEVDR